MCSEIKQSYLTTNPLKRSYMRILTVSKPYVSAAYREKLCAWAEDPSIQVGLIVPPNWDGLDFEEADDQNIAIFQVPIYLNGRNHFHFYSQTKLLAAIKAFKPTVLNIEEEHYSIVTAQLYRIAKQLDIPRTFYTWQNIAKKYPPPFSWIERYIFANTKIAIAGNQEAGDILLQKGFSGQWEKIPQMGVPIGLFYTDRLASELRNDTKFALGLKSKKTTLGFAGRLVEEKGIQTILEALSTLPSATQDELEFVVIGSGPFEHRLKAIATELKLKDELLLWKGPVPSRDIPSYLQAFDFLLLPSLTRANWKEQFGRILIEAMAAGCIPIGSSSGEIPKVIGDPNLIFDEGDPSSFNAVLLGLKSSNHIECMRKRVQRRAIENFSNANVAEQFMEVFKKLESAHEQGTAKE